MGASKKRPSEKNGLAQKKKKEGQSPFFENRFLGALLLNKPSDYHYQSPITLEGDVLERVFFIGDRTFSH